VQATVPATNQIDSGAVEADPAEASPVESAPDTTPDAPGAAQPETAPNQVIEGNATFIRNPDGSRHVELAGAGDDSLRMIFSGSSWVEVDDPARKRLYSDLMRNGDELVIQGGAPFHILLGDATQVRIEYNSRLVDLNPGIRTDNTARLVIDDAGMAQWVVR
jgi:cytoskeleton protein RodZ